MPERGHWDSIIFATQANFVGSTGLEFIAEKIATPVVENILQKNIPDAKFWGLELLNTYEGAAAGMALGTVLYIVSRKPGERYLDPDEYTRYLLIGGLMGAAIQCGTEILQEVQAVLT